MGWPEQDPFCDAVILNSGKVRVGNEDKAVKWAEINATTIGDTPVVAAVTGKKIRVLVIDFACSGAVGISWKSGSTVIRNAQAFAANGGIAHSAYPGWFAETSASQALAINLDAAVNVRGSVSYVEV